MKIVTNPLEMQTLTLAARPDFVGFVPTMGALHKGHLQLIKTSQAHNQLTVVSIFVNPTQFNNLDDFAKYPKTLEQDQEMLKTNEVDFLFLPTPESIYPDQFKYLVEEKEKTNVLCGPTRPGHFSGVLTVVLKLLNIVQPHRIYLGEKDYQQLIMIKDMVNAFFMPVEVIGVPTVRDEAGLALSSRNHRLSEAGLLKAREFAAILKSKASLEDIKRNLKAKEMTVDYIEDHWNRRFGAVFIEDVRLIDNVPF